MEAGGAGPARGAKRDRGRADACGDALGCQAGGCLLRGELISVCRFGGRAIDLIEFTIPRNENAPYARLNHPDLARMAFATRDIEAHEGGFYFAEALYEHPEQGKYSGTLRFNWLWQADNVTASNLEGEWELLDARTWFEQRQMVPAGGRVRYGRVKDNGLLLVKDVVANADGVVSPGGTVDLLDPAGTAHIRTYVLNGEGVPDRGWGVRAAIPIFDQVGEQYLMLKMDLSDGSVQVMAKTKGQRPQLATLVPRQPQPPGGTATPGGLYQTPGSVLQSQSQFNGQITTYQFQTDGQTLLLQDTFGNVYQFSRSR
jgi:hypothetical protein